MARFEIAVPRPEEVEAHLRALDAGAGPGPALRRWLELPEAARAEEAARYRIARALEPGGPGAPPPAPPLAGAYLHPGGFLLHLEARDDAAARALLRALRENAAAHGRAAGWSVGLGGLPLRRRGAWIAALGRAGYRRGTDVRLRRDLVREEPDAAALPAGARGWDDVADLRFRRAYEALEPSPWPWRVVKRAGGAFRPELWLLAEDGSALVGLLEPDAAAARAFVVALALGGEEGLEPLLRAALQRAAALDEVGVVRAVAREERASLFERLGFVVEGKDPVFRP